MFNITQAEFLPHSHLVVELIKTIYIFCEDPFSSNKTFKTNITFCNIQT